VKGIFVLFAISTLLVGCSEYIRRNEMSGGEILYRSRCSACHMLIKREALSKDGWRIAVERYGKNLKEEEKEAILEYLAGGE